MLNVNYRQQRSSTEPRKSSETKLGEALEHDDWKNMSIKSMTYHIEVS